MPHNYSCVLTCLNNVFVLFPQDSNSKYGYMFRVLSWSFVLITAIVGPLSIVIKDGVFSDVPLSSKVVYDLSFVFLYATNIYISGISIFKRKELRNLLEDAVNDITSGYKFIVHSSVFLLIHLVNTVCILMTQLKRTDNVKYCVTVVFVDGYLTFRLITGLFIIFMLVENIKMEIRQFNADLMRWNSVSSIKRYRYLHNDLCDCAQNINHLFGVPLLLIIFYFITSFLRHAVFVSLNFGVNLITVVRCLWILSYGFQAAYLAHVGEQIANETQKTIAICYKLMPKTSFHDAYGNINSELFLLAQQAFSRPIKISAAGFFNVENSMILFMATTFFTYFIVVMQLLAGRTS